MKQLLLSAISVRQQLIRANKSYITGSEVEQFMANLRYWLDNGIDPMMIAERWDRQIRTILTKNFIKKYENCKH